MKKLINFFSNSKAKLAPLPLIPENTRVYSIGDIHGRADLLLQLLALIDRDSADFTGYLLLIYLGDYIDRGSNSKQVIDILLKQHRPRFRHIYLRGNHEQTLLDFLDNADVGRSWLNYGGQTTLVSYDVKIAKIPTKREEYINLQQQLADNIPETHLKFFNNTTFSISVGNYFFVHAGINPNYSLKKQQLEDFLWIRDEFIASKKIYEKIIVHGHTISHQVELLPNRIGIDTGAFCTGILTCLILETDQQRLLQTSPDDLS